MALITNPPKAGRPIWVCGRKTMFCKGAATLGLNKVGGIMIKAIEVDVQAFSPLLLDRAGKSLLKCRKSLAVHLIARVRDLVGPPVGEPIYDLTISCPGSCGRAISVPGPS